MTARRIAVGAGVASFTLLGSRQAGEGAGGTPPPAPGAPSFDPDEIPF